MFGYAKLFRSRWWALAWAAGVILMALELTAPDGSQPVADGNLHAAAE
jgi:hypothetical protein